MIDKLSKKVLEYLQTASGNTADYLFDFDDDLDTMAEKLSANSEDVRASVRFLNEQGLVKYAYSGKTAMAFYLDHRGLHFKELNRLERRERWKERLWGFLSGVASTLLTAWLIGVLSISDLSQVCQ